VPDCLQCLSSDGPLPILDLSQIVLTGTGGNPGRPASSPPNASVVALRVPRRVTLQEDCLLVLAIFDLVHEDYGSQCTSSARPPFVTRSPATTRPPAQSDLGSDALLASVGAL
jgi:hypothetical protein